jgi:hypothetical protein
MPSSRARGGSEKRKAGNGADPKRSRAFSQPLKMPRKSLSSNSEDGNDNDGFSFGHMMSYMMFQIRVESEQKDRQNRIDAERREREYERASSRGICCPTRGESCSASADECYDDGYP